MEISYPGVFVEELPAPKRIEGVPTEVAVFIGVAEAGPYATPTRVGSWREFENTFGRWTFHRYLAAAVATFFREGGRRCQVVRVRPTTPAGPASVVAAPLTISATSEGRWPAALKIQIADSPPRAPAAPAAGFSVAVLAPSPIPEEGFGGRMVARFVLDNEPPTVEVEGQPYHLLERFDGLSDADLIPLPAEGPCPLEERINTTSWFVRVRVDRSEAPARPENSLLSFTNAAVSGFDFAAAIATLADLDDVGLVAVPDGVGHTTDAEERESPADQRALTLSLLDAMAARRRRQPGAAFVLADPPFGLDPAGVIDYRRGSGRFPGAALDSDLGALYYPWLRYGPEVGADPAGPAPGQLMIPPSGAVAGRIAATDVAAGVFKAAAGIGHGLLAAASGIERAVTAAEQDLLNPAGVNVIRSFPGRGISIWGARTLSTDAQWRYVPSRRLALFLEASIHRGLAWVVFERNDAALWNRVTRAVQGFLTGLWRQGALAGVRPQEAFFVRCGPALDGTAVDRGLLTVEVGFAPVRPAEFVILRIGLRAGNDDD